MMSNLLFNLFLLIRNIDQIQLAYVLTRLCAKFFCLFDLILYAPSTIFQFNRDGSFWVEPVLSWDKCVLLKDHNAVTPVRLEPAAPRSRGKHSTTMLPTPKIYLKYYRLSENTFWYYLANNIDPDQPDPKETG